jgi:hypothetical protein
VIAPGDDDRPLAAAHGAGGGQTEPV